MPTDSPDLSRFTQGEDFVIERVRLVESGVAIEGRFQPPSLAKLSSDDQIFIAAFLRAHGSIKEMESLFGISYPTVKNRLARIAAQLEFVEIDPPKPAHETIAQLERGEISAADAVAKLKKK